MFGNCFDVGEMEPVILIDPSIPPLFPQAIRSLTDTTKLLKNKKHFVNQICKVGKNKNKQPTNLKPMAARLLQYHCIIFLATQIFSQVKSNVKVLEGVNNDHMTEETLGQLCAVAKEVVGRKEGDTLESRRSHAYDWSHLVVFTKELSNLALPKGMDPSHEKLPATESMPEYAKGGGKVDGRIEVLERKILSLEKDRADYQQIVKRMKDMNGKLDGCLAVLAKAQERIDGHLAAFEKMTKTVVALRKQGKKLTLETHHVVNYAIHGFQCLYRLGRNTAAGATLNHIFPSYVIPDFSGHGSNFGLISFVLSESGRCKSLEIDGDASEAGNGNAGSGSEGDDPSGKAGSGSEGDDPSGQEDSSEDDDDEVEIVEGRPIVGSNNRIEEGIIEVDNIAPSPPDDGNTKTRKTDSNTSSPAASTDRNTKKRKTDSNTSSPAASTDRKTKKRKPDSNTSSPAASPDRNTKKRKTDSNRSSPAASTRHRG